MRILRSMPGSLSRKPSLRFAGILTVLLMSTLGARAQDDLHKVLAQMDAASAKFQNAQANFQWDTFEAAVQETDTEKGVIAIVRKGGAIETAIRLAQPEDKHLVYKNGELQLFEPKINHLTLFSAGANRQTYESFLSLGFGGSGSALEKTWELTYKGQESVDGIQTAKLDLVAKQASVRSMFSHITLWVDTARGVTLKQQMFEPSGDYRTAHYTQVVVNGKVPPELFTIKTDSKTTVVHK